MAAVINFSVDREADQDIIAWLDRQPNKSAAIRAAIRAYMADQEGPTLADILAEIRSLPSRLSVVRVASQPSADEEDREEPAAAAANLDELLDRLSANDL